MIFIRLTFLLLALAASIRAQEITSKISVQERQAGENKQQQYFLLEHKDASEPAEGRGLILILPGGPGTKDFLPFCANVLTLYGIPSDFVVAQLVAPQWSKNEDRVVWPGKAFPDPAAKFASEDFLAAVIKDVSNTRKIDARFVFTLGWSSSGHVLYSASASNEKVHGSIIAMSRFFPGKFPNLDLARGKNYFLFHSPEDQICPFRDAQLAEQTLKEHGANVKLVSYKGGHGWQPNTFYCDRIKEGILWLKKLNSEPPGATNVSPPIRSETNQSRIIH